MSLQFDQKEMHGQYQQRLAQAIMQYGVGAMIDFPDRTLTVAAPETWCRDRGQQAPHIIHDTRFERSLSQRGQHIRMFKAPRSLNYVEFPFWHICPKCHRLQTLADWRQQSEACGQEVTDSKGRYYPPRCPQCKRQLVPARLVVVCEHGHLDDFPWVEWTHYCNQDGPKGPCAAPTLVYESGNGTEMGEDIRIKCTTCGAEATLKGAFAADAFAKLNQSLGKDVFHCTGHRPERGTYEACSLSPRAFPRGASSVYFSFLRTSLILPPLRSALHSQMEESNAFRDYKQFVALMPSMGMSEEDIKQNVCRLLPTKAKEIAAELGRPADAVEAALREIFLQEGEEVDVDDLHYRLEEYEALSAAPEAVNDETMASTFHKLPESPASDYNDCLPGVNLHLQRVALIDKIGVVRALLGYSRVRPATTRQREQGFVPVKEPETDFYPAFQVFGEGIFIELAEADITAWLQSAAGQQATARVAAWKQALQASHAHDAYFPASRMDKVTPKFLLLHTLSHLLMRELSYYCGYSIASLSERIYCADAETQGFTMAGIFIYTASGDAEGTLGGLIRQGRSDTLPLIMLRALRKAKYCSNDPICIDSKGQGLDGQNLAACHSCALLPETSCEEFNVFLDRGVVVGTFDAPEMGFYSDAATTPLTKLVLPTPHEVSHVSEVRSTSEVQPVYEKQPVPEAEPVAQSSAQTGWAAVRDLLFDAETLAFANRLEAAGVPVPDQVGAELLAGRCQAEMVWEEPQIAYLTQSQMVEAAKLRAAGWRILSAEAAITARDFAMQAGKGDKS